MRQWPSALRGGQHNISEVVPKLQSGCLHMTNQRFFLHSHTQHDRSTRVDSSASTFLQCAAPAQQGFEKKANEGGLQTKERQTHQHWSTHTKASPSPDAYYFYHPRHLPRGQLNALMRLLVVQILHLHTRQSFILDDVELPPAGQQGPRRHGGAPRSRQSQGTFSQKPGKKHACTLGAGYYGPPMSS